ncbi:MAG: RluA family pseudouridine synthase [Lentisphaeria bacterium]
MSELPFPALIRRVSCRYTEHGTDTLLDFLARRFNYLSRAEWLAQLQAGNLTVDQQPAVPEQILQLDALLEFRPRTLQEPRVSWEIQTLFEDEHLLLLNKPPSLPCHPAGAFFNHTLWAWLKQSKKLANVHFCNRLDRESSGIVSVGKNSSAAALLNQALQQPEACKEYLVLVHGHFSSAQCCPGWLIPDNESIIRKKRRFVESLNGESGRSESVSTDFVRLAYHAKENISLLKATLHTGRMHQIRASLCSLGFPVIGDKLYGLDERLFLKQADNCLSEEDQQRLILPHQALHAWKIQFCRSNHKIPNQFTAGVPATFQALLDQLKFSLP